MQENTICACRCLDRGTLPATAQHVKCLTGGSHPPAPSIPPGIWASWPPRLQQDERARKPTQLCELAEGRGPEAAARHSQSQQSERPALFWRASREWPLLLQRVCSRFLLQTGAFCAATGGWPALSPLSSSLYGLQWWSFHCLLQGEGYDQRRALFNFFVSSLFNIVNLNCPLTNNHLNVKDFWRFADFLLKEIKSNNDGWIPMQKWEYINGHLAPLMNHWLGWQLECITHVWEQHIGPLCDVYGICGNGKWNNDHN